MTKFTLEEGNEHSARCLLFRGPLKVADAEKQLKQ